MASRISRRALLALAGSAALAAAAGPAAAQAVPVRDIHVTATSDGATLQTLAQMVGEEFVALLGARYVRGARTGGTLVVTLTGVDLVDSTGAASGGRHRTFNGGNGGNDQLEGTVALLGPRREVIAAFPLLAVTGATFRADWRMVPDPRRLQSLAHAFAYWAVGKLG